MQRQNQSYMGMLGGKGDGYKSSELDKAENLTRDL